MSYRFLARLRRSKEIQQLLSSSRTSFSVWPPSQAASTSDPSTVKPLSSRPFKASNVSTNPSSSSTSFPPSETISASAHPPTRLAHPSTSLSDLHPLPSSPSSLHAAEPAYHNASADQTHLADQTVNWSQSFCGLSQEPFGKDASQVLMAPLDPTDVEIKPDGVVYLPEIKYRRILNKAFGPGGWGLAPRGSSHVTSKNVSREYGLICLGRLVSLARGEQDYYNGFDNVPTATEGCKSNALMRCCKDLGIASELWDPNYIRWWKSKYATVEFVPATTGLSANTTKKKVVWKKKPLEDWAPVLPSLT